MHWLEWKYDPLKQLDCDDCRAAQFGNPPCDKCTRPEYLMDCHRLPLKIWEICHVTSRPIIAMVGHGNIPASELIAVTNAYNGDLEDFEETVLIESTVWPFIQPKKED